ncbi:bURP domain-containing protein 4 isoform 2 [Oryza sativa Japonica Group]|uniref:bURP domain-containing protein 4 isoform 2 n=1 Tax=Oryza sativa subsp. japonica TaxID=39947 RepID=UPI00234A67AE|nr:bURP domain-containing protein 4 isoform 2 [Oryza sativa Japonica Group]
MVGKGNECAAARRRFSLRAAAASSSSSSFLPCLLLAAALSAGCCRAHAATARAPRSLLARFPTTKMTSELEKEAGRYVDDSSQAARTNNKITNLQVSFVGHGHDTPADGNAPFIDAAYPVKWSPRADGPPKQPATFPASPNGNKAQFTDAAYPVDWNPRSVAPPTPPAALSSLAHPGIHIQRGMLFLMKKLHPGAVLPEGTKLALPHGDHGVAAAAPRFIYKDKGDAVPFDLRAMDAILAMFGILPGSDKAAQVADTLRACSELTAAGGGGEEPRACCATSREAVLDFAASALGTSAPRAVTTLVHGREPRRYVVAADGVARIGGDAVVACHPMPYLYEVYYCHRPADAVALRVDLHAVADVGLGGATAVAVCHVNTTTWDSAYFELLKASRGDAICHYMPQGYVLWLAN